MEVNKQFSDSKSERKRKDDNICRLCASTNANIPIFPDKNELKTNRGPPLVCKIMSSVNIQVFERCLNSTKQHRFTTPFTSLALKGLSSVLARGYYLQSKDQESLSYLCSHLCSKKEIVLEFQENVRKDDGLPTNICNDCAAKVESTYEFLRLCEMSDSFLRQYLDFGLHLTWIFRYSEILQMIDHTEEESNNSDL